MLASAPVRTQPCVRQDTGEQTNADWGRGTNPNSSQTENRESLRLREPGDIFTQHTSLGTSQDKKKWVCCFHFNIYPISVCDRSSTTRIKSIPNRGCCSFIAIVASHISINLWSVLTYFHLSLINFHRSLSLINFHRSLSLINFHRTLTIFSFVVEITTRVFHMQGKYNNISSQSHFWTCFCISQPKILPL